MKWKTPGLVEKHKDCGTAHNRLTCKVQGLHNAASVITHSHYLVFTIIHDIGWNSYTGDQIFKEGVVVDSLALKYRHIFKNVQQKNFRPNDF